MEENRFVFFNLKRKLDVPKLSPYIMDLLRFDLSILRYKTQMAS